MKALLKVLTLSVTLCIPFFLLMGSINILLKPIFLDYEYGLPGFPADDFGFSTVDRLKWGNHSLAYLTNQVNDDYLATLKFEDGSPLYNERELKHMLDVRNLVQAAVKAWYIVTAFLIAAGLSLWKAGALKSYWKAISYGGWLTLGLILAIIAAVLINFDALFAGFHAIFFEGDTWLFFTNDTLIRLFPEKLWSDAFIYMGIFTLVGAILCVFVAGRLAQKE